MSQTAAARRRRWKRWIGVIALEVSDCLFERHAFEYSMRIAKESGSIQPQNAAYQLWRKWYGQSLAIGVRRLLDNDDRSYSLQLLLQDIERHRSLLSRRGFVQSYPKHLRGAGKKHFTELVGGDHAHVLEASLKNDIRALAEIARRVTPVVHQRIAHKQRQPVGRLRVSFATMYRALNDIDRLTCKYYELLTQCESRSCAPCNINDFDRDFLWVWGQQKP